MQETPAKTSTNHKTEGNNPFCSSTGTWAYICHAGTFPQSGKAFKTTTWSQNCGCETPFSLMYVIQGCSNNQELLKNRRPTTKPRAQGPLFPFLLFSVTRGFLQSYETGATPIGICCISACARSPFKARKAVIAIGVCLNLAKRFSANICVRNARRGNNMVNPGSERNASHVGQITI